MRVVIGILVLQKYCGRKTEMGKIVSRLRKIYCNSKIAAMSQIMDIMGESSASSSNSSSAVASECDSTEIISGKSLEATAYGSGCGTAAVLLPGFAINW